MSAELIGITAATVTLGTAILVSMLGFRGEVSDLRNPAVGNAARNKSMQFAYREMLSMHLFAFVIATATIIVVLFAIIGPTGSHGAVMTLHRLAYGGLYAGICLPIYYSMTVITLYILRLRSPLVSALAVPVVALLASVPSAALAYTVEQIVRQAGLSGYTALLTTYLRFAAIAVAYSHLVLYLVYQRIRFVAVLGESGGRHGDGKTCASLASSVEGTDGVPAIDPEAETSSRAESPIGEEGDDRSPPVSGTATDPPQKLLDLLPVALGRDVIFLKSEDHYVRICTTRGESLIMIRFSDITTALDAIGMQVHRSYWIAHRHVVKLERRRNGGLLHLTGDHQVPVSATYLRSLRATIRARE